MRDPLLDLARIALVAALLLLVVRPVGAQSSPLAVAAPFQSTSAQSTSPGERSPLLAGLLQAVFSPLPVGYLYAGSPARGLSPMGARVVGSTLFLVETVEIIDWTSDDESETLLYLGLGMTLGGYVFGIVDAANVTRRRNARLRAGGAAFRIGPTPSGVGITVALPVGPGISP